MFKFSNCFIICFFTLLFSCSKRYYENDLYGVWKGEYNNKEIILKFNSDRAFEFSLKDLATDSIEILNGIYTLDFTKMPIPLSLRKIKQLNHPLHTIIKFIDTDCIRLGNFSPSWRIRNISFEQNKIIVLKRLSHL